MTTQNNNNNNNNCNFIKIVPDSDTNLCSDHYSVASFKQGIFDSSSLDNKRKFEIINWINENKNKIVSIECFLLKHPLFDMPLPLYPMFEFVHHSQLGFIFKDKNGRQIRHFCSQLQNAWWPPVSYTVPFNLAQPCKIVNVETGNSRVETNFLDQTSIFGNFLETKNYTSEDIVLMNKYVNVTGGIGIKLLNNMVNFNFYLESYRIWRMQNTAIPPIEYEILLKNDKSDGLAEQYNFLADYGQTSNTATKKDPLADTLRLNGTGDGKLFVLNGFSPSYWSINEGAILHFATINGDEIQKTNKVSKRFTSFINWIFNNLQCYDNPIQHNKGYARTYITLSTSALSLDWVKKNVTSSNTGSFEKLSSCLRPIGDNKASWITTNDKWNPYGEEEKYYETIMTAISESKNLGQLMPTEPTEYGSCKYDYSSCPLVPTAGNYNCETYSGMVISMILNTNIFNQNGVTTDRKFNFNFPNSNSKNPELLYSYKGPTNTSSNIIDQRIGLDSEYNLSENLLRQYAAYWPVAIYEDGYETGIFETDFNKSTNPNIIADRDEYAKQSMVFQYLFTGLSIEAANTTGNPVLKLLSEIFTFPLTKTIVGMFPKTTSTMAPILNNMMYCLFLYEFLKVETVYLNGYKCNDIDNTGSFTQYPYYDCEPAIYKFKIGNSTKRGMANSKLIGALFKWITKGNIQLLSNFKLFEDSNLTNEQQKTVDDIKSKFNTAAKDLNNLTKFPENVDCNKKYPIEDCDTKYPPNNAISDIKNYIPHAKCEYNNLQNQLCNTQNITNLVNYGVQNTIGVVSNTIDALLEIVQNKDIAAPLLKDLSNFVIQKTGFFFDIIVGNMLRFTTWCHQNYELNCNIMANRFPDSFKSDNLEVDKNTTDGIGNLRRRTDGICSKFSSCALQKLPPNEKKSIVNFQVKSLPNTKFNITNPLKYDKYIFIIIVMIIVFIFIALWVFLAYNNK